MSSHKDTVNHKIDAIAGTAKDKTEKVIDSIIDASHRAAEKAAEHAHDAGKHIRNAGEKIMTKADER